MGNSKNACGCLDNQLELIRRPRALVTDGSLQMGSIGIMWQGMRVFIGVL